MNIYGKNKFLSKKIMYGLFVTCCRRKHLKECFETLKAEIPNMDDKKTSNLSILRSAFRYIQVGQKCHIFPSQYFVTCMVRVTVNCLQHVDRIFGEE